MKKEISPLALVAVVVVLLALVGFFFYRGTSTPPPMEADPLGNPAKDAQLQGRAQPQGGPPPGMPGATPDVQGARGGAASTDPAFGGR